MGKFNVGDKVRVHNRGDASTNWIGTEGVVDATANGHNILKVTLTKATAPGFYAGFNAQLLESNLELVEEKKEFSFADIKKGDTIRRTYQRASGLKNIQEGVATVLTAGNFDSSWSTLQNEAFVWESDDKSPHVKIELVDREPHWAHTKPVGSVALDRRFGASTYRKVSETEWEQHFLITNKKSVSNVDKFAAELRNLDPEKLEWLK